MDVVIKAAILELQRPHDQRFQKAILSNAKKKRFFRFEEKCSWWLRRY